LNQISRPVGEDLTKKILSNPLFSEKRQYYDTHKKEWEKQFSVARQLDTKENNILTTSPVFYLSDIQAKYFQAGMNYLADIKKNQLQAEDEKNINYFFKEVIFKGTGYSRQSTPLNVLTVQQFSVDVIEQLLKYADQKNLNMSDPAYSALQNEVVNYLTIINSNEEFAHYKVTEINRAYGAFIQLSTNPYKQIAAYLRALEQDPDKNVFHEYKITSERYLENFLMPLEEDSKQGNDFIAQVSHHLKTYNQRQHPLYNKLEAVVTNYLNLIKETEIFKENIASLEGWNKIKSQYTSDNLDKSLQNILLKYDEWIKEKGHATVSEQISLLRELRNSLDTYMHKSQFIQQRGEREHASHVSLAFALWQCVDSRLNQLQGIVYEYFVKDLIYTDKAIKESKSIFSRVSESKNKKPSLNTIQPFTEWQKAIGKQQKTTIFKDQQNNTPIYIGAQASGSAFFHQESSLLHKIGNIYQEWEKMQNSSDLINKMDTLNIFRETINSWVKAFQHHSANAEDTLSQNNYSLLSTMLTLKQQVDNQYIQIEQSIFDGFLPKRASGAVINNTRI
ncbi:MAG: hypothetical protein JO131_01695, partial [Gammaproteobacteria bacterium]|nr:hypothetical protein [Gammaproteobacteria bacterium]